MIAWMNAHPDFFGKVLPALLWLPCVGYAWLCGWLTPTTRRLFLVSLIPSVLLSYIASYVDVSNRGFSGEPTGAHLVLATIILLMAHDGWYPRAGERGWPGFRRRFITYAGLGYLSALVADFSFVAVTNLTVWNIGGAGWRDALIWNVLFTTLICAGFVGRYRR